MTDFGPALGDTDLRASKLAKQLFETRGPAGDPYVFGRENDRRDVIYHHPVLVHYRAVGDAVWRKRAKIAGDQAVDEFQRPPPFNIDLVEHREIESSDRLPNGLVFGLRSRDCERSCITKAVDPLAHLIRESR